MKQTFRDRLRLLMKEDKPYTWARKVGIEKGLFQYYWQKGKCLQILAVAVKMQSAVSRLTERPLRQPLTSRIPGTGSSPGTGFCQKISGQHPWQQSPVQVQTCKGRI